MLEKTKFFNLKKKAGGDGEAPINVWKLYVGVIACSATSNTSKLGNLHDFETWQAKLAIQLSKQLVSMVTQVTMYARLQSYMQ